MKQLSILHLINSLGPGGAEKTLVNFLIELKARQGLKVELVTLHNNDSVENYMKILQDNGISVANLGHSAFSPLILMRLRKIIQQGKFDIVHAHLFPSFYWLALTDFFFDLGSKLIFTEHSTSNHRMKYAALKPLEKSIYKRYHYTIAITDAVGKGLLNWVGSSINIRVIPNGIPLLTNFSPYFENMEHRLLFNSKKILFMAARLDKPKRQDLVLKALKILGPGYHLLLAGEGQNLASLKDIMHQLELDNQVTFLGHIPDVNRYLNLADINILASDYEGLSGFTLEAMNSRKPFIGSNVPGIQEVVALPFSLFENTEVDIAEKISNILGNPAFQKDIVEANAIKVQNFSLTTMVDNYLNLYHNTLN